MRIIMACLADGEDRRLMLEAAVEAGFAAEMSTSLFHACRRLLRQDYDLLIVDADSCSGEPEHVAETVMELAPHLPLAVLSEDENRRKLALSQGAADVLERPLRREVLVTLLRKLDAQQTMKR
jgi:DNA-binding NtrC family response regulator